MCLNSQSCCPIQWGRDGSLENPLCLIPPSPVTGQPIGHWTKQKHPSPCRSSRNRSGIGKREYNFIKWLLQCALWWHDSSLRWPGKITSTELLTSSGINVQSPDNFPYGKSSNISFISGAPVDNEDPVLMASLQERMPCLGEVITHSRNSRERLLSY